MTCFVLVHGAFRGSWSWDRVRGRLEAAGHEVHAPDLRVPAAGDGAVGLDEWVGQVVEAARGCDDGTVVVGHSQGGVVVRAAAPALGDRIGWLGYLDAPIPRRGERAVDLTPGGAPDADRLPPADTLVPPAPLTAATLVGTGPQPEDDDPARLADWVNERLTPTPFGPSLDPVDVPEPAAPSRVAFCTGTPPGYPCWTTRARMDDAGQAYELIAAGHDAPLTHPGRVTEWLLAAGDGGSIRGARPAG